MCVVSFVVADHVSLILHVVYLSCSLSKSDKFRDVISISKQNAVKMIGEFGHDRVRWLCRHVSRGTKSRG
jgi:hypothetical protein